VRGRPCRWKASRVREAGVFGGPWWKGHWRRCVGVGSPYLRDVATWGVSGCVSFGSPRLTTPRREPLRPGRPLCAEGKDKAKAGVVNQSPRHPERGMPATASSRRRGQLDVEGHAWRRHEAPAGRGGRRARARVSERERTHDAHDNKLVAETGDRSFSSVAEGAPRSVVGSRQEIAQQATTTHAKTRRVGFAG